VWQNFATDPISKYRFDAAGKLAACFLGLLLAACFATVGYVLLALASSLVYWILWGQPILRNVWNGGSPFPPVQAKEQASREITGAVNPTIKYH
jgi:hypothetical protein